MRNNNLGNLAALLGVGQTPSPMRYQGAQVAIREINVLPQPRKTFSGISELALDIAKKNLLSPPIVARFDTSECERYIIAINRLWRTEFSLAHLTATINGETQKYYVLLAGERRLRSCKLLWEEGCGECRELYGQEPPGACFRRHFGGEKIEVRLCLGIEPLQALFLQLSENTHMSVPAHEEAHAYSLLFNLVKQADAKLSMAQFAREVGRSPAVVKNALRFCELPQSIQEAVEKGYIRYGVAVELARLQEHSATPEALEWWMLRAITKNMKVEDFRDLVTKHIASRSSSQISLADIFQEESMALQKRLHIRKVVASNMVAAVWVWIHYLEKVSQLLRDGLLGKEDSPFSEGSPKRIFRNLIEREKELLPLLQQLLPKQVFKRAQTTLGETEAILNSLPNGEDK